MKRILAVALVFGCLIATSQAGPKAIQRPIPDQFFSEKTVLVSHFNIEAISSARITAAIKAIVPAEIQKNMPEDLQQQMGAVDNLIGQLKALGITRVSSVSIARDPAKMTDIATYILFPVTVSATAEQQQQVLAGLQQTAAGMKMKAEAIPGWVVVHQEQALPEESDDVIVEDAAFNDALGVSCATQWVAKARN